MMRVSWMERERVERESGDETRRATQMVSLLPGQKVSVLVLGVILVSLSLYPNEQTQLTNSHSLHLQPTPSPFPRRCGWETHVCI